MPSGDAFAASFINASKPGRSRSSTTSPWQWWSTSGPQSTVTGRSLVAALSFVHSRAPGAPRALSEGSTAVDQAERDLRREHAEELRHGLAEAGVSVVATSFVDNAGISRVKAVPLERLPHLAAWGVGFSPAFDYFRSDDWVAAPASGEGPAATSGSSPTSTGSSPRRAARLGLGAGRALRAVGGAVRRRRPPPAAPARRRWPAVG